VSVATVSRAMNGHDNVLPETRDRVLQIAAEMRFMPSNAARSLIMRRTHTIGALLPDLHGDYFSELIRGIDLAARARGLHLLVSSSHGDASEAASALRAMNGRVDGLLVMSPHVNSEFLWGNVPEGLPAVMMNTRISGSRHSSFSVDNYGGALAMLRHLVETRPQAHRLHRRARKQLRGRGAPAGLSRRLVRAGARHVRRGAARRLHAGVGLPRRQPDRRADRAAHRHLRGQRHDGHRLHGGTRRSRCRDPAWTSPFRASTTSPSAAT
jgi:DNA-binding LacI/PurR family transcriptional regulator